MKRELEEQLRRRVLGWGIACTPVAPGVDIGQDLEMIVGENGRDFARVEAIDNLNQSLEIALTTALGTDIFNTQFGFDGLNALAEETNPILIRERVRVSVIQTLRKDPRIRRIVDLKLQDGRLDPIDTGDDPTLSPQERLLRWRTLNVRVVFEAISGDEAVVSLGSNLGRIIGDGR